MGFKIRLFGAVWLIMAMGTGLSVKKVQAQSYSWQKLSGPYGNNVINIETMGSTNVFASTFTQGTGWSEDMGKTWKMLPDSVPALMSAFYTSKGTYLVMGYDSLYRVTNNGKTWNGVQIGDDTSLLLGGYSFAENVDSSKVYLATNIGLFVSDDDGKSFNPTGLTDAVMDIHVLDDGRLVALTDLQYSPVYALPLGPAAVQISDDGGISWTSKDLPGDKGASDLEIDDQGNWYVPIYQEDLYKSPDEGDTWNPMNFPDNSAITIAFSNSGKLLVGYDGGLDIYNESSQTFEPTNLPDIAVSDIEIAQDGGWLVGSADLFQSGKANAIFRSDDGGNTWDMVGASTVTPESMTINDQGDLYVGSDLFGLFKTANKGTSWNRLFTGDDNFIVIKALSAGPDGHMLLSSFNNQMIYYSTDYGENWQPATIEGGQTQLTIMQYMFLDNKNVWAAASSLLSSGKGGLYASTDTGKTWSFLGMEGKEILCMGKTDNAQYVGTNDGLYKTTDNGTKWDNITQNLENSSIILTVYAIIQTKDGSLLAGTNWGIQRSTDGGATWKTATDVTISEYPSTSGDEIVANTFAQNSKGELFAGTGQYGILYSDDDGQSWKSINSGYQSMYGDYFGSIIKLSMDKNDNLYAASSTGGIYKAEYHDTPIENLPSTKPVAVELGQNYPNPFNPTTNIPIKLVQSGKVKLTVFDVLGRRVATLVDGNMRAGIHQVTFDASMLSSGVYFYRLQANEKVITHKMLLLK